MSVTGRTGDRRLSAEDDPAGGLDGASVLTGYLILLVAIPSQLVLGPLGGAGSPALLVGVGCLLWWLFARFRNAVNPVRDRKLILTAACIWALSVLASYVAAAVRPNAAEEMSVATLGMVVMAGWLGVLLLAHDGIANRAHFSRYLRRLSLAGAVLATFGLFQFLTNQAWTDQISIPGLSANTPLYGTQSREGFTRPTGTSVHPIEFGAVLAMLLPVAVTQAVSRVRTPALRRWYPPVVMLVAIMLSSTRSSLVTAAIGTIALIPVFNRQMRRIAGCVVAGVSIAIFVLVPGMLGTLLGLFTGISTDTSSLSRLDGYGVAARYIELAPVFGRGFGTFLPRYRIFDNEYLLLTVETGFVGVAALLGLLGAALLVGIRNRRLASDISSALAAQGLVGAVAAGAVSLALFDAFSFPMVPGLLFLLVGLLGATALPPVQTAPVFVGELPRSR